MLIIGNVSGRATFYGGCVYTITLESQPQADTAAKICKYPPLVPPSFVSIHLVGIQIIRYLSERADLSVSRNVPDFAVLSIC